MIRPSPPRLPELAGMTEAGFNRVVAMITPSDFIPRHGTFGAEWAWGEWRASLPKVRNKKQRKADARRVNYGKPFPLPHCSDCNKRLEMFDDYTLQGKRYCGACTMQQVSGTWEPTEPLMKPVDEWRAWTAQEIVDAMKRGIVEAHEQTLKPYVPRVLPCSVCGRPTGGCCTVMAPPGTPLQRLMRFAAEDGTPVSFEIAEAARKGEW